MRIVVCPVVAPGAVIIAPHTAATPPRHHRFSRLLLTLDDLFLLLRCEPERLEDVPEHVVGYHLLFDDGVKSGGVVAWLAHFATLSRATLGVAEPGAIPPESA